LPRCLGVFALQCVGEVDFVDSGCQIFAVQLAGYSHLAANRLNEVRGEQGNAVFRSLAVVHDDLTALELDVLDA